METAITILTCVAAAVVTWSVYGGLALLVDRLVNRSGGRSTRQSDIELPERPTARPTRAQIHARRAQWRRLRSQHYTMTYTCSWAWGVAQRHITVQRGVIAEAVAPDGSPVTDHSDLVTIDELFELLDRHFDDPDAIVAASFDAELGYPSAVYLDSMPWSDAQRHHMLHDVTLHAPPTPHTGASPSTD